MLNYLPLNSFSLPGHRTATATNKMLFLFITFAGHIWARFPFMRTVWSGRVIDPPPITRSICYQLHAWATIATTNADTAYTPFHFLISGWTLPPQTSVPGSLQVLDVLSTRYPQWPHLRWLQCFHPKWASILPPAFIMQHPKFTLPSANHKSASCTLLLGYAPYSVSSHKSDHHAPRLIPPIFLCLHGWLIREN